MLRYPSGLILTLTTAIKWCPRILPLRFARSIARIESASILTLILSTSALRNIIDVASKMLTPLGIVNSRDPDNSSIAARVALAALRFSWARCSMIVTFSLEVWSLVATCAWVNPVARSLRTFHCFWVNVVPGGLNLVNFFWSAADSARESTPDMYSFIYVTEIAYVGLLRVPSRGAPIGTRKWIDKSL